MPWRICVWWCSFDSMPRWFRWRGCGHRSQNPRVGRRRDRELGPWMRLPLLSGRLCASLGGARVDFQADRPLNGCAYLKWERTITQFPKFKISPQITEGPNKRPNTIFGILQSYPMRWAIVIYMISIELSAFLSFHTIPSKRNQMRSTYVQLCSCSSFPSLWLITSDRITMRPVQYSQF